MVFLDIAIKTDKLSITNLKVSFLGEKETKKKKLDTISNKNYNFK